MSGRVSNERHALVFSGGGAKGGYEIGVMKALFQGASPATNFVPLEVEIFTGTSVGAYNATFMSARSRKSSVAAMEELEEIWCERIANTSAGCGNGIFRLRGLPLQGFDLGCLRRPLDDLLELAGDTSFFANFAVIRATNLISSRAPVRSRIAEVVDLSALFSVAPFEKLVRETIDLDQLRVSQKRLTIAASNWREGSLELFTKDDITERFGLGAILASAAIPGIFPPVDLGGTPYVDGGVLNNTPLRPAIRYAANVLHVIYLDPLVEQIPFPRLPNTLNTVYRMYAILQAANINNDINTARNINRALEIVRGETSTSARDEGGRESVRAALPLASGIAQRQREGRPYRKVEIHRYRPVNDLGGGEGLLDFTFQNIQNLIQLGYRDAVNHNCTASRCDLMTQTDVRNAGSRKAFR